jgi:hypothetical protein
MDDREWFENKISSLSNEELEEAITRHEEELKLLIERKKNKNSYKVIIEVIMPARSEDEASRWAWRIKDTLDEMGYISSFSSITKLGV